MATLSLPERLDELFRRLAAAPAVSSADEALALVGSVLEQVEDEFSGVPKHPNPPLKFTGRMYPPQEDHIARHPDGSLTATTRRHSIEIGRDGAILIRSFDSGFVCLDKPSGVMS